MVSNIKEWLTAYKAKTGKTNEDIAQAICMTRRSLEARLSGASEFNLSEAVALAKLVGVPLSTLCTSPFELSNK